MDRLVLLGIFLLFSASIMGQQDRASSLYMFNKYKYNVAFGGLSSSLEISLDHRSQWGDLTGGPSGDFLTAHLPLYVLHGGVGIIASREKSGPEIRSNLGLSYNYVVENNYGIFSGGISLGLAQRKIDGSILRSPDGVYDNGNIQHNDPHLSEESKSGTGQDIRVGLYYANYYFEAGLSAYQLSSPSIDLGSSIYPYFVNRGFHAMVFGHLDLDENIKAIGSMHGSWDEVNSQVQTSLHIMYNNNMYGGLGVRGYNQNTMDAIIIFGGVRINEYFKLFYAYEHLVSRLKTASSNGTHEFNLSYNLNKLIRTGLPPKIIYNPRF